MKWYLKREGLLDVTRSPALDYYLVLAGPKATARDSTSLRPWVISSVHLFDAQQLLAELERRNIRIGVATSVTEPHWRAAEIYPTPENQLLPLTQAQRNQLARFS